MILTNTPYRISFFGGGTDYPQWYLKNGGEVISSTIDKYVYISCRHLPSFFDHKYRIVYSRLEMVKNISSIKHLPIKVALKEIEKMFFFGADKVVLNTIIHTDNNFLQNAVKKYGSQSIVVCVDIKKINGNKTIELNILFINSELIKFFHNFVVLI